MLSLAVLLTTVLAARAAETVWTDGTGDWFLSPNWSAGVPTNTSTARINNGGTSQVATSGATAGTVYLGFGTGDSGTLSVSGAGRLNATLDLGASGTGTLTITNGGVVTGGRFTMGDLAGSTGVATVSGAGSKWDNSVTCFIGSA